MTADYSAIPLSMSVLPHFSKKKKGKKTTIYQSTRKGSRATEKVTDTKAMNRKESNPLQSRERLEEALETL